MGAGHVPADVAPVLGDLAAKIPVVLATRAMTGPVFTRTYGYAGSEIDLIARNLAPAGYLSGLKARLLLGFSLRSGKGQARSAKLSHPINKDRSAGFSDQAGSHQTVRRCRSRRPAAPA